MNRLYLYDFQKPLLGRFSINVSAVIEQILSKNLRNLRLRDMYDSLLRF